MNGEVLHSGGHNLDTVRPIYFKYEMYTCLHGDQGFVNVVATCSSGNLDVHVHLV